MSTNRGKSAFYSKIPFVIHHYGYNFATEKHRETQKKHEKPSPAGESQKQKKGKKIVMKKIVIMCVAIMMALTTNAERIENVAPFSKVNVSVQGRVRIIQGEAYGVSICSDSKETSDAVRYTVKDGVLSIDNKYQETEESGRTVITIITPTDSIDLTAGNGLLAYNRTPQKTK